jgi:glycerol-3-phosphate acyltransferase PlsY
VLFSTAVMSALLIWRHAENLSRLVKGTESKLGAKKT